MTKLMDPKKWVREGDWKKFTEAPLPLLSKETIVVDSLPGTYADIEHRDCPRNDTCVMCDIQKAAWRRRPLNTERLTSLGYGLIPQPGVKTTFDWIYGQ